MFLLWQASPRAVRKGNNCLTTAKIMLFSEMHNFFTCFFAFSLSHSSFVPRNSSFPILHFPIQKILHSSLPTLLTYLPT